MIHLLIFNFLTFLLILIPVISKPENKTPSLLTNVKSLKKATFLKPHNLLPTLIFMINLFEYMFQNNFGVQFLWTSGFISWILGCCFWLLKADLLSLTFIAISIIFCSSAIYDITDLKLHDISALKKNKLRSTPYLLIISISVLTMLAFKSLAIGLTTNILLLLLFYDWKAAKKPKQNAKTIDNNPN